jgi:hypothetical protein
LELRAYANTILRHRLVAAAGLLVTFLAAVALTLWQSPLYEATARYIVRPAASLQAAGNEDFIAALVILSGRTEIATTFAEASQSRAIRTVRKLRRDVIAANGDQGADRAAESLRLSAVGVAAYNGSGDERTQGAAQAELWTAPGAPSKPHNGAERTGDGRRADTGVAGGRGP